MSVGNAQRAVEGTVLSAKPAYIRLDGGDGATAAGGALGGALASTSDSPAVIIAGIVGGALVGKLISDRANTKPATEYVIKTTHGVVLTVAQINEGNETYSENDNVILVYGFPSRLIRNPK